MQAINDGWKKREKRSSRNLVPSSPSPPILFLILFLFPSLPQLYVYSSSSFCRSVIPLDLQVAPRCKKFKHLKIASLLTLSFPSLLPLSTASTQTVPLGLAAITLQASLYDVPGGYRAVMFDRFQGVKPVPSHEGTHFLVPWLQRAILYDVRVKPRNISTTTGSKDLQMVS